MIDSLLFWWVVPPVLSWFVMPMNEFDIYIHTHTYKYIYIHIHVYLYIYPPKPKHDGSLRWLQRWRNLIQFFVPGNWWSNLHQGVVVKSPFCWLNPYVCWNPMVFLVKFMFISCWLNQLLGDFLKTSLFCWWNPLSIGGCGCNVNQKIGEGITIRTIISLQKNANNNNNHSNKSNKSHLKIEIIVYLV